MEIEDKEYQDIYKKQVEEKAQLFQKKYKSQDDNICLCIIDVINGHVSADNDKMYKEFIALSEDVQNKILQDLDSGIQISANHGKLTIKKNKLWWIQRGLGYINLQNFFRVTMLGFALCFIACWHNHNFSMLEVVSICWAIMMLVSFIINFSFLHNRKHESNETNIQKNQHLQQSKIMQY